MGRETALFKTREFLKVSSKESVIREKGDRGCPGILIGTTDDTGVHSVADHASGRRGKLDFGNQTDLALAWRWPP